MILLIDYQYFSPIMYYKSLFNLLHVKLEQYETYQKMSFRNRAIISCANGLINLSVPLKDGRNQRSIIKDVQIDNKAKWQSSHWKSIVSCYNKSPWFEFYKDELMLLFEKRFDFLVDWDLACFEWVVDKLGLEVEMSFTETYQPHYGEEVMDFRNKLLPKNYQDFEPVVYRQVFEKGRGFIPNLSILDLLFCEGKRAKELLAPHN
ncbi:MAG: WbqC family protein [Bacteroidetes bacterium]|nr:WbqC family protein [Bacteroidota bacterium]